MAFGERVLFEAVLVAALLAADLTVPSQPLEAFRLHLVGDVFRGAHFCFRHNGGGVLLIVWIYFCEPLCTLEEMSVVVLMIKRYLPCPMELRSER
jgi:hypothetical protein